MDEQFIKAINYMIQRMPKYGELLLTASHLEHKTKDGNTILSEDWNRAFSYLKDEGFISIRYDINTKPASLTDKGREYKQLGSITAFLEYEEEKQKAIIEFEKTHQREILRNELQYQMNRYQLRVNICIAIATTIAALYYLLEILRIQYHLGLPYHVFFV